VDCRGRFKRHARGIPNGLDPEALQLPADHELLLDDIQDRCGFHFVGKKILLTVGRRVSRKLSHGLSKLSCD